MRLAAFVDRTRVRRFASRAEAATVNARQSRSVGRGRISFKSIRQASLLPQAVLALNQTTSSRLEECR